MRPLSLAIFLINVASAQSAPVRHITVDDALQIVGATHPGLRAARARATAASAAAHAVRGNLLPSLHVSDTAELVQSSFNVAPSLLGGANPDIFKKFPTDFAVNVFSVAAEQHLLGLLRISQDYTSLDATADASQQDVKAANADTQTNLKANFLRYFEAKALAETAAESEKDLQSQVVVAQKKVEVGSLTTADVLRLQVAAANARQQVIAADGQAQSMRAALLEMLSLGDDDGSVQFVEPQELHDPPAPGSLQSERAAALKDRPELLSSRLQADAAQAHARSKTFKLLPDIDLSASYLQVNAEVPHNANFKGDTEVTSASVGLAAKWAVWEWGAAWYDRQQAEAQADAALATLDNARAQVGAEVAARRAEAVAASAQVDVATVQVDSAQEAYRVTKALTDAGTATTTDLLDAQAALTQARMSLVRARYEAAIASVALDRATGASAP